MPFIIGNFLSVLVELLLRYGKIYSKNVFNFLRLVESHSCVQRVKSGMMLTTHLMLHVRYIKTCQVLGKHNKWGSYVSDDRCRGLEKFQSFLQMLIELDFHNNFQTLSLAWHATFKRLHVFFSVPINNSKTWIL